MKKEERAAYTAAIKKVEELQAQLPPSYKVPVLIPPPQGSDTSNGFQFWDAIDVGQYRVQEMWSYSFIHGYGARRTGQTAIQGAVALYTTKQDAYVALRLKLTGKFADCLEEIDRIIEELSEGE